MVYLLIQENVEKTSYQWSAISQSYAVEPSSRRGVEPRSRRFFVILKYFVESQSESLQCGRSQYFPFAVGIDNLESALAET